jgi:hypothetical protein
MHLRRQPPRTVNRSHHCDLIILLPNLHPNRMNRRIFPVLPPHMQNAILHIGSGNLMISFDSFARSFLIDSIAIINVKTSGSTKLIIPTSRMFGSSLSRTQWGTSPTLFRNLFRSSHTLVYDFISCQLAALQNIERCFKLVVATIIC